MLTDPAWRPAVEALAAYPPHGVSRKGKALAAARRHGWSPGEVVAFVEQCAATAIDGRQAWGPGPVYYQLCHGAGANKATLTIPPDAPYRRARERRLRAKSDAERRRQSTRGVCGTPIVLKWSHVLEAMSVDEIKQLIREHAPHVMAAFVSRGAVTPALKMPLLVALQRRDELANQEEQR